MGPPHGYATVDEYYLFSNLTWKCIGKRIISAKLCMENRAIC